MDLGLNGRVYIVTGASRGLGRAVAETLVSEGARVLLSARDPDAVRLASGQLGRNAAGLVADNADPETPERLVVAAHEHFGRLDGAVFSVGGPPAGTRRRARSTTHPTMRGGPPSTRSSSARSGWDG